MQNNSTQVILKLNFLINKIINNYSSLLILEIIPSLKEITKSIVLFLKKFHMKTHESILCL